MQDKPQGRRLILGAALFFIIMLAFCGKLVELQLIHGEAYLAQSLRKNLPTESVEAARGLILDRNGMPLVTNRVSYRITLELDQMGETRDETILTLIGLCREAGIFWEDSLPVASQAPYLYEKESAGEADLARYTRFLEAAGLSEPEKATALLDVLETSFKVETKSSPQNRRTLLGVLYECALRQREITWSPYYFAEDVDVDFIARVRELGLLGVRVTPSATRSYETAAAAHILGRVGRISEEEWETYSAQGYDLDALVGKDGVEKAFESYLHGEKGVRTLESDLPGTAKREAYTTRPQPGSNVVLTLDLALQEKAEQVLEEQLSHFAGAEGAAVAILDVKDGGVLTLASYPSFDLSHFSAIYHSLREDPLRPLFNRALQGTYAPGSTYKMVTAVAALEEGIITPQTQVLDTGIYTYYPSPQPRCWLYRQTGRTHGLETVAEAITDSCNIFFYDVGRRLGISQLEAYARAFGLGESTGIELPGESLGVVSGPVYTQSLGATWYDGNTLSAAIGQENNRFTPLQLASYVATLAGGGTRYQAHLLREIRSSDTDALLQAYVPEVLGTLSISPENLNAVKEGMLAVTTEGSVASYFRGLDVPVGAKTGSAQVTGSEEANAVFVCFAPYDDPEIAMAIVVEKGGSGSELGAIAAEILTYYFQEKTAPVAETPTP